jgi:hypothetical protein
MGAEPSAPRCDERPVPGSLDYWSGDRVGSILPDHHMLLNGRYLRIPAIAARSPVGRLAPKENHDCLQITGVPRKNVT